jgi:hypothetical protein
MANLLQRVILVGAGLIAGFGFAEILVRIAAAYRSDVNYFATAGVVPLPVGGGTLEDVLRSYSPHLEPHRVWRNYYANALGFTDEEFAVDKPPGTLRAMALGDSFAYGMVAYPQNVLTLVEQFLRTECTADNIEIMNFGIPATGVSDYRLVHGVAASRYKPDVVIIHFYMGNDGPDLVFGSSEVWSAAPTATISYAWNYMANFVRVARSTRQLLSGLNLSPARQAALGGKRVSEIPDVTDHDFRPSFSEESFERIEAAELTRHYRAGESAPAGQRAWKKTFGVLDALTTEVLATTKHLPIIIFYPSQLQVYPAAFESAKHSTIITVNGSDPAGFDEDYPNRTLEQYCQRWHLRCFDVTPAMRAAAAASPDPLYLPRDSHWNVRGNRVAAEAEAGFLKELLCTSGHKAAAETSGR